MAIIRVLKDKNNPYVMVNKTCLQDNELSWKAKGLHTYLMSLPDDWQIFLKDLTNRSSDGRYVTASTLKELEEKGYLVKSYRHNGRLQGGYDYEVYETPIQKSEIQNSEKQKSEIQKSEKQHLLNNKYKLNNNIELNNEIKLTNKEIVSYSNRLLGEIGPNNKIMLLDYLDDGVEKEVIIKAIDIAVANGNRNFTYVKGILNNWLSDNLKTIIEVEDHQQKFEKKKSKGESNGKYKEYAEYLDREDKATVSTEETRRAAAELGIEL